MLVRSERLATGADTTTTSKLKAKFNGPYRVLQVLDFDNYKLELPANTRAYNIFHVSNLLPYTATTHPDLARPGPATDNTNDDHYIVDRIIGHRTKNGRRLYLVKWRGYPRSEATYEPTDNLRNILDLLIQYCMQNKLSPPT